MDRYMMVLAGAGLGGLMRYTLGTWITSKYAGQFPLGTLAINVGGSFLIGLLMTLFTERVQPHENWQLFLVVGVLGGFTTFSSFEYETFQAVRYGYQPMAFLYVLASVVAGFLAVWLGVLLAARR